MCFLDLVGYTRLTDERGDQAAADLAAALALLVDGSARVHGGWPVKWVGDGVMVYFREPTGAVLAALEMVEGLSATRLPQGHLGIAAGPVVGQGGDYFGRTVNLAARICSPRRTWPGSGQPECGRGRLARGRVTCRGGGGAAQGVSASGDVVRGLPDLAGGDRGQ